MLIENEPDLWNSYDEQCEKLLATIKKQRVEAERPGFNIETLRKHRKELDRQVADHEQTVQKLIESDP